MQNHSDTNTKNYHRRTAFPLLFIVLTVSIAINLFPFHAIRLQSRQTGYPEIIRLANGGLTGRKGVNHRMGLYLALGQKAPGANLILPKDCPLDIAKLYGLGRARYIKHGNYKLDTGLTGIHLSRHIVTSFNADPRLGPGPYVIALGKKKPENIIFFKNNGIWYLVDAALLPINSLKTGPDDH